MTENKTHLPHLDDGELYPKQVYDPPPKGEVPHYVRYMDKAEAGLRTIKMIVYAGMTAFVILAIYGYYLIYQLTDDAARMAATMEQMQKTMMPMGQNIAVMTHSTVSMAESVNRIQYSTGHMDRSFSGPMNIMNRFTPWGGGGDRAQYPPTPFVPNNLPMPPARAYSGEKPN